MFALLSSVLRMGTHTRVLRVSVQRRPGKQGFIHIPPKSIMGADPATLLHFVLFSSVGARPKLTKRNSMDSVELWNFSTVKVSPYHLLSTVLLGPPPPVTELLLFHCRTGRTRTLRASPGGTRVRFHSRARGKATLTASRQTRGRGWTRQSMPMTSPCTCRLQWL